MSLLFYQGRPDPYRPSMSLQMNFLHVHDSDYFQNYFLVCLLLTSNDLLFSDTNPEKIAYPIVMNCARNFQKLDLSFFHSSSEFLQIWLTALLSKGFLWCIFYFV